jgi:hypothetical protein
MKSINIKKVAAVAAGTVMLVGAACAAVTGMTKDFVVDANGNPNVQIVVGSNALASDGIAAGNLAAVIGNKAYLSAGGQQTVKPVTSGTAKISVAGGSVTLPEASVRSDVVWAAALGALTLSSAQGLAHGTLTYRSADYDYEEEISTVAGIGIAYGEGNDYHGISFTNVKPNRLYYKFKFSDTFPIPGGSLSQTLTIPFLGSNYVLNKLKGTEAELVKGEEKTLGIGQSADVTFGGKTYTVKLDDARLNEVTTTGQATISVTVDGSTTALSLDTANEQSKKVGDFMVFLQSVAKSYTPGQGGSATVRVGGDVLLLKDGQNPTTYPDWKARIVTNGGNSSNLDRLDLIYDKTVQAKDQVTQINGPADYFSLQYVGDEVARGQWASTDVIVSATSSVDAALDEITYTDVGYERTYTVPLNDDINQIAFLATNATGYLGTLAVGNYTPAGQRIQVSATAANMVNTTGMNPLYEDDIFFVADTPVRISSITTSTATTNAQVQFSIGYGGDSTTTKTVKASDSLCTAGAVTNGYWMKCSAVPMVGANNIEFYFPWNSSNYTGTNFIAIGSGADDIIDYKYATVGVNNMIFWMSDISVTRNDPTQATNALQLAKRLPNVVGNCNNPCSITPEAVNVTDSAGVFHNVAYNNATTNAGINVTNAANVAEIDQANTNSGYDNNKFQYTVDAWMEALSTESVKIMNAENSPRSKRTALIRGAAATSSASDKVVSSADTFPVEISSGVTVTELTCSADDVKYTTGVTFGTVGTVVVDDNTVPGGNAIVIGGHLVNKLAVGQTEAKLTKAGDKVEEMMGKTVYVAGYTAADTVAAVNSLIAQIKAL